MNGCPIRTRSGCREQHVQQPVAVGDEPGLVDARQFLLHAGDEELRELGSKLRVPEVLPPLDHRRSEVLQHVSQTTRAAG